MHLSQFLNHATVRAGSRLLLVVLLLITGLLVVIGNGLWQNQRLLQQLEHITADRAVRIQLSTDLLEAAYNRHQSLINQLLTDDPFERDALRQQYDMWGNRVGQARRSLREHLNEPQELAMLARQDALIPQIVSLQDEVVELLGAGQTGAAMAIISQELFALDRRFDEEIEALRSYEREGMTQAAARAHEVAAQSRMLNLFFGAAVVVLALLLLWLTGRALHGLGRQLQEKVGQLEKLSEELHFQANHDSLTGLLNRRAFFQRLEQAIALAERQHAMLALVYVDLDNFKPINDQYGHAVGDELLVNIARRLGQQMRVHDSVARIGGDEFVILFQGLQSEGLDGLLQRLREVVSAPLTLKGTQWKPSFSLGLALYPEDGLDAHALLHQADLRMYEQKQMQQRRSAGLNP